MPYGEPDHDDPMEFVAVGLPALSAEEEDEMVRCVIEEYCWLGWDERQLWKLFTNAFYQAPNQFFVRRGAEHVRRLIEEVVGHPVEVPPVQVALPILR